MIDLALDGRVMIRNIVDEAVQELDLLFNTDTTELIGYPEYGTNFEQFLWRINPEEEKLKQYIKNQIASTLYLSQLKTDVEVSTEFGVQRLIYNIKIHIYNEDTEIVRNYEFR